MRLQDARIDGIYGMQYGVEGLLREEHARSAATTCRMYGRGYFILRQQRLVRAAINLQDEDPARVIDYFAPL